MSDYFSNAFKIGLNSRPVLWKLVSQLLNHFIVTFWKLSLEIWKVKNVKPCWIERNKKVRVIDIQITQKCLKRLSLTQSSNIVSSRIETVSEPTKTMEITPRFIILFKYNNRFSPP